MFHYDICKIDFPRFLNYLAYHGELLNIKDSKKYIPLVVWIPSEPSEPSTSSVMPQMSHTTPNTLGITLREIEHF